MAYLYCWPCIGPTSRSCQMPSTLVMGAVDVFQPLNSPVKCTAEALGAHTRKILQIPSTLTPRG